MYIRRKSVKTLKKTTKYEVFTTLSKHVAFIESTSISGVRQCSFSERVICCGIYLAHDCYPNKFTTGGYIFKIKIQRRSALHINGIRYFPNTCALLLRYFRKHCRESTSHSAKPHNRYVPNQPDVHQEATRQMGTVRFQDILNSTIGSR